jgi:hypothetical protein
MVSFSMDNEELFKPPSFTVQKKRLQGMPRFIPVKSVEVDDRISSRVKQPAAAFPGTLIRCIQDTILIVDLMDLEPYTKGMGFLEVLVMLLVRGLG